MVAMVPVTGESAAIASTFPAINAEPCRGADGSLLDYTEQLTCPKLLFSAGEGASLGHRRQLVEMSRTPGGLGVGRCRQMLSSTKLVVAVGGLALSLTAGVGIASAGPDVSVIVNSTCSYPQVMAALNAQSPATANQLSANPLAVAWLQQLVASPPDGRTQMVQQAQGVPAIQQYTPLIMQVANSCNNY